MKTGSAVAMFSFSTRRMPFCAANWRSCSVVSPFSYQMFVRKVRFTPQLEQPCKKGLFRPRQIRCQWT